MKRGGSISGYCLALGFCLGGILAPSLPAQPAKISATCAACHPSQARAHAKTLMAKTLQTPSECEILAQNPDLKYETGMYRYRIERKGSESIYTVTNGQETFLAPIRWAVGQGEAGQTYLLEHEGRLWESRVSYYNDVAGLGVTIGAPAGEPANLKEAVGRLMSTRDVVECMTCHTAMPPPPPQGGPTPAPGTLEWTHTLQWGVQCSSCHKDVWKHAGAMQRGDARPVRPPKLKQATPEEMNDLCGVCHRTWEHIQINGPRGVANVRFQPYRIVKSKCYDAVDARISCVACHDPHARDAHRPDPQVYDKACLNCHSAAAASPLRQCRAGSEKCSTCHMPKYEIPGSHFRFTDHMIRVVKDHAKYPD